MAKLEDETLLSIGSLAKSTGISVDKLRIWERRYGAPKPVRLPSGHRRYTEEEAIRLKKAAIALDQGFPARIVAAAPLHKLNELLGLNTRDDTREPSWDLRDLSNYRNAKIAFWIDAVYRFDERLLLEEYNRAWENLGPLSFILDLAVPFLWRIGEEWTLGRLTISHEHYVSEQLGDFLAMKWRSIPVPDPQQGYLLASLPGDQHRLGLQMAAIIIKLAGKNVVYLGPQTPIRELLRGVEHFKPEAICLSISSVMDERLVCQSLEELRLYVPEAVSIVIGGKGSPSPPPGVERIYDLRDFFQWIQKHSRAA
ncbi:MAG: MerR family transcriptional regulator [Candidatus Sumerlaeia bacterium]|nr:MerR family transcriptional regulator [Candidatus Sumerlaeia bacterium]